MTGGSGPYQRTEWVVLLRFANGVEEGSPQPFGSLEDAQAHLEQLDSILLPNALIVEQIITERVVQVGKGSSPSIPGAAG